MSDRIKMTVPAHAVETVFKHYSWFVPAGIWRGRSMSQTVTADVGPEVEEWCDEHDIAVHGYYNYTSQQHHVVIYGSPQAMLFKLRWL